MLTRLEGCGIRFNGGPIEEEVLVKESLGEEKGFWYMLGLKPFLKLGFVCK